MTDEAQMPSRASTGSRILDEGFTPAHWVRILADHDCEVSERSFREWANKLGACYRLGRTMLVTREQFDVIVASRQQKARSKGPHHRSMEVTQSSASSNTLTVIEDLKIIAKGGEPSQRMIARREAIQKRFIPD